MAQHTPDAGLSGFWYDKLGRLSVSQNAQQKINNKYSYTLYDLLGRINEVGQKPQAVNSMSQAVSQDPVALNNWVNVNGGVKEQITQTVYDQPYAPFIIPDPLITQKNLRNRVSYTTFKNLANEGLHYTGTFYTYDVHGNVDTLLQDYVGIAAMNSSSNRFKLMAYDYDLISGKVNLVSYQPKGADAFYHKYYYDAENRITSVETSRDKIVWERDAAYNYYKHGPLARMVLGQNQVQGNDYAYTLQGWLKGVNSTTVSDGTFDMGTDGLGVNAQVARDVFGFSLNYYNNDYKSINATAKPFAAIPNTINLFNGNINSMAVNIPKIGEPLLYQYRYDQLNRLLSMNAFKGLNSVNNTFTPIAINDYAEAISYDPNGNIVTYKRNGFGNNINLNNYSYTYLANTNQLTSLKNIVDNKITAYGYDAIGNVIKDEKQNVLNNTWNVYGKLQKVEKKDGKIVYYSYDASGNRISKIIGDTTEIYVRDAAGNVMLTYQKNPVVNGGHVSTKEFYKYGSNLLGVKRNTMDVQVIAPSTGKTIFTRGEDEYYVYDHLGNVRVTLSDKKIQVDANADGLVDFYTADIKAATLYSTYGTMSNAFNGDSLTFAFNGQKRSTEISATAQTAEFWEYNSDVGRRWNLDPKPSDDFSPYSTFENNPIWFSDPLGDTIRPYGNAEATNTRLTDKGGTVDLASKRIKGKEVNLVPASKPNGEIIGYNVWDNVNKSQKPIGQIESGDLNEFQSNQERYVNSFRQYYQFGEPSLGQKLFAAGFEQTLNGDYGEGMKLYGRSVIEQHKESYTNPYFYLALGHSINGAMSNIKSTARSTVSTTIREQKQLSQHTIGGSKIAGKSYLSSLTSAKEILKKFHANGATIIKIDIAQNRVYIKMNTATGTFVHQGVEQPTNYFMIKGKANGAVVVPIRPGKKM